MAMSFDVFLFCYSEKDGSGKFPRSVVDETLGSYIKGAPLSSLPGRVNVNLEFNGRYGGTLSFNDDEMIDGFSINRPGGEELYSILLDIMKRTSSALCWPGGSAVADAAIIPNLEKGMVENLPLRVVLTVDELLEHIQST
jgi:hypothetical protein